MRLKSFLDNLFSYHAPFGDQPTRYGKIREQAKQLAIVILANTPESREQGLALDALRVAVMYANASIACNEVDPGAVPAEAGVPVPSVAPAASGPVNVDGDGGEAVPPSEAAPAPEAQPAA